MKMQEAVFSKFSQEKDHEFDLLTVWKNVVVKNEHDEWDSLTAFRATSNGGKNIEIFLRDDEVKKLKEIL